MSGTVLGRVLNSVARIRMCFRKGRITPLRGLDEYECHALMYGRCPIDDRPLDEMRQEDFYREREIDYEEAHCLFIAQRLLSGAPGDEEYHHISNSDGRHRECIVARLAARGIDVAVYKDRV